MAYSEAQRKATKRYKEKNKERAKYLSMKSSAKSFVAIDERQKVDGEEFLNDLKYLQKIISNKIQKYS